jgi:hypothetical protein
MPSLDDTGTRGRDASIEELKVLNVARAPARFRAFPDDTWIGLKGDKPFACVGPILKFLDSYVISGLAAGATGEERPRDVDHMRRALALVEQRRAAPGTEAPGRRRPHVLEPSDTAYAAPCARRLAAEWSCRAQKAGKSISSSTAPQRQRPETCRPAARSLRLSNFMLNPRIEGRVSGQTFTTNTIGLALRRQHRRTEAAAYQAMILKKSAFRSHPQLTSCTGAAPSPSEAV